MLEMRKFNRTGKQRKVIELCLMRLRLAEYASPKH